MYLCQTLAQPAQVSLGAGFYKSNSPVALAEYAQLAINSGVISKGEGFTEQRLIDDQIVALTGQRFLSNYQSTQNEYQALLNAGVMAAKTFQLSPGVVLNAEQMASLAATLDADFFFIIRISFRSAAPTRI